MPDKKHQLKAFERLLTIMDELREQCPWDKKQTMETLRHLTIEEVYELGDAILDNDLDEVKKELGDVLFYTTALANFYAGSLGLVMEFNVHKLDDREKRNKLQGNGDNR